jgi:ribonuclease J
VTVIKACRRAGRQFIIDLYTAEILQATGNERLPLASWDSVRVFLPASQKRRIIQDRAFEVSDRHRPYRIFPEALAAAAPQSVMLFRPSMVRDVEDANCLEGGSVISVWRIPATKEAGGSLNG